MGHSDLHSQTPLGRVPDSVRIYAIGDIHGRVDLLDQVLTRIDVHLASNPIHQPIHVFLGDYVDRGPASRSVLDCLINRSRSHTMVFLKGNHEVFFTDFLTDPLILDEWRKYGGLETLVSYGLRPSAKTTANQYVELAAELERVLPQSHRQFFLKLKTSFVCGDYFFVHAGVRPGISLDLQREEDLLWIREEFLRHKERFDKIIVHGHTPVPQPEIHPNRINIDTGAYATGNLTCLVLEAEKLVYI
jgi:serine/threonine protein phosphatase 1